MRTGLAALLLALLAGPVVADGAVPCERRVLKPKARLALPRFRVPAGPGRPLALAGRERPVHLDGSEERVGVPLDGEAGLVHELLLVEGDPEAGEPELSAVSLTVLEGRIGREKVMFVDFDADGTFFTPYVDFLVSARDEELQPVAPVVVLHGSVYRVEYEEATATVTAKEDPEYVDGDAFPNWAGVARGLAHLNDIRGAMNLPPLALSREASRKVMLHVHYLERNGGNGHLEEEDRPGFTREGLEAGIRSIGSMDLGGVPETIDGHLGSLLHRLDLLDPRTTEIGIGADASRVWIYTETERRRQWEGQGPVIFPGPDASWHMGYYTGENPDPRPEGAGKTSGLPVTAAWFGQEDGILDVGAELFGPRGPIECWKRDSTHRELMVNSGQYRAALMPQTTLTSGRHRLVLTWKQHGEPRRLEYDFRIGRR
jgi:hypothetical protein